MVEEGVTLVLGLLELPLYPCLFGCGLVLSLDKGVVQLIDLGIAFVESILDLLDLLLLGLEFLIELLALQHVPGNETCNCEHEHDEHNPESALVRPECLLAEQVETLGHADAAHEALLALGNDESHEGALRRQTDLVAGIELPLALDGLAVHESRVGL